MQLSLLFVSMVVLVLIAYRVYSRWIAQKFGLRADAKTPAHQMRDDNDFVPTSKFYLFGQHFSAIAAAGPIAGPILACQLFGWGPCLVWIGVGAILIGAVHDFSALVASIRHKACSVAEVAHEYLGAKAGRAFLIFIWITLMYIIVAFADITASSFVSGTEELSGSGISFNAGGAVAMASVLYLSLSIVMGLVQKFLQPPLWLVSLIFVPAAFFVSYLGTLYSHIFIMDAVSWGLLILSYCAIASVTPVWLLLQPRGYLGGFILYAAIAVGAIGVLFGGYEIKQDFFKGFQVSGSLFPFLFVTIACGACSGFHGLVCGGTTSKQLDKETDAPAVGYGAMLAEAIVAVIALVTIMIVSNEEIKGLKPGAIYGQGIGNFLTLIIGKENLPFAITFGAMAFSTFVFDTLDVATRLGRYIFQELSGLKSKFGSFLGVLLTLALPVFFMISATEGSWIKFWTLFGASNQLLAALTLLSVSIWLYKSKRPVAFTLIPMIFILIITFWALIKLAISGFTGEIDFASASFINSLCATAMILLAAFLLVRAFQSSREST